MRASTAIGTVAAAGAAVAVGRLVDRYLGAPATDGTTGNAWLRDLNKRFVNPLMVRAADLNLPYPAVVGHVGRVSGRAFRTPVVAAPTATGFVVPLPYGRDVDWCQNLVAAGGGSLRYAGETYPVGAPTAIGRDQALAEIDGRHRAIWSRLGPNDYLRLDRGADGIPGSSS